MKMRNGMRGFFARPGLVASGAGMDANYTGYNGCKSGARVKRQNNSLWHLTLTPLPLRPYK